MIFVVSFMHGMSPMWHCGIFDVSEINEKNLYNIELISGDAKKSNKFLMRYEIEIGQKRAKNDARFLNGFRTFRISEECLYLENRLKRSECGVFRIYSCDKQSQLLEIHRFQKIMGPKFTCDLSISLTTVKY